MSPAAGSLTATPATRPAAGRPRWSHGGGLGVDASAAAPAGAGNAPSASRNSCGPCLGPGGLPRLPGSARAGETGRPEECPGPSVRPPQGNRCSGRVSPWPCRCALLRSKAASPARASPCWPFFSPNGSGPAGRPKASRRRKPQRVADWVRRRHRVQRPGPGPAGGRRRGGRLGPKQAPSAAREAHAWDQHVRPAAWMASASGRKAR